MADRAEHAGSKAAGWMILGAVWLVSLCRVVAAGWWAMNHAADGAVQTFAPPTTSSTP